MRGVKGMYGIEIIKENKEELEICIVVRELRTNTGMSQSKFSSYFDIPLSTLQDWEHGRRTPPIYIIMMMQRILELEKELAKKRGISEKD